MMSEETNAYYNELIGLVDRFCSDGDQRSRTATELALIAVGRRLELSTGPVRGDLSNPAKSLLPPDIAIKLYECARQDERSDVQCEAIYALGELGGDELVSSLLENVERTSTDDEVFAVIVEALGKIGGYEVWQWLGARWQRQDTPSCVAQAGSGLYNTHCDKHPEFREEMKPKLGEGGKSGKTLARQVRETLEDISENQPNIYARWLAKQCL